MDIKLAIVENYRDVVSKNMDVNNIEAFVDFMDEHSFKSIRLEPVKSSKWVGSPASMLSNSPNIILNDKWRTLSHLEKFRILSNKFDYKTIRDEWSSELSELKPIFELLDELSEQDLNDILKELDEQ